jgi:general stress protein CsbA
MSTFLSYPGYLLICVLLSILVAKTLHKWLGLTILAVVTLASGLYFSASIMQIIVSIFAGFLVWAKIRSTLKSDGDVNNFR